MTKSKSLATLTAELSTAKGNYLVDCLKASLRAAIKLEFATIPPYLTAMWSIQNQADNVARTIREVVVEEMLHMGLACNMLVGLGEDPHIDSADTVPVYPSSLPGDVNPQLNITLRRLTPSQIKVFMDIEYPEDGPVTPFASSPFSSIGAFYGALLKAFEDLNPSLDLTKQREEAGSGIFVIKNITDVRRAVDLIRRQGEGSNRSPEEMPGRLAHFYQFREVYVGSKYVRDPVTTNWGHNGPPVIMPVVWPMADIPPGGYLQEHVTDANAWSLITQCDAMFTTMLKQLERAWQDPTSSLGDGSDDDPIYTTMFKLSGLARDLIQIPRTDSLGNYGPCFRLV